MSLGVKIDIRRLSDLEFISFLQGAVSEYGKLEQFGNPPDLLFNKLKIYCAFARPHPFRRSVNRAILEGIYERMIPFRTQFYKIIAELERRVLK